MRMRQSKLNFDDVRYSYVVLRKGDRPEYEENAWGRIVMAPLKRDSHVNLDVCSPNGNFERMVIGKRHGKQIYYDARKSKLNDLWPHEYDGTVVVHK